MKAKELYEKYKAGLMNEDKEIRASAISDLVMDLLREMQTILKTRHVQFDRGVIPIMREQNGKYKAVVRMFEREYGMSPIREDGFEIVLEEYFPCAVEKMKGRAEGEKLHTPTREGASDA